MHHSDFNLAARAGFTALLHYFRCPLTCPAITTPGVNVHKLPVSLTRITFIAATALRAKKIIAVSKLLASELQVKFIFSPWNT